MLACKNRKLAKRGVTQSGGRNEKPRQHWCVAWYPLLLTASFASILGGGDEIRTHDTVSRIHTFQACAFNHSATPPHFESGHGL